MNQSNLKNMVVLKNLPSNIVEEAIVILKTNKKVKKLEKEVDKIRGIIKAIAPQISNLRSILFSCQSNHSYSTSLRIKARILFNHFYRII